MMRRLNALRADRRGASAIEFAFAAPVLILMLIGMVQMGILFEANAGLHHAINEGARYATIYPLPTDSQIIAKVNAKKFGLQAAHLTGPTITHGVADGNDYAELTMSYAVPLDFVLFDGPSVTLTETQRAYLP